MQTATTTVEYQGFDATVKIFGFGYLIDLAANGMGTGTLRGETETEIQSAFMGFVDQYADEEAAAAMEQWDISEGEWA